MKRVIRRIINNSIDILKLFKENTIDVFELAKYEFFDKKMYEKKSKKMYLECPEALRKEVARQLFDYFLFEEDYYKTHKDIVFDESLSQIERREQSIELDRLHEAERENRVAQIIALIQKGEPFKFL